MKKKIYFIIINLYNPIDFSNDFYFNQSQKKKVTKTDEKFYLIIIKNSLSIYNYGKIPYK